MAVAFPPSRRGGQWLRGGSTGGAAGARPVRLPPPPPRGQCRRRRPSPGTWVRGCEGADGPGQARGGGAGYERATDAGLAGPGPPRSCADSAEASHVPPRPRGVSPGTGRSPGGEVRTPGLSLAGCELRAARAFCLGGGGGGERGSPRASRRFDVSSPVPSGRRRRACVLRAERVNNKRPAGSRCEREEAAAAEGIHGQLNKGASWGPAAVAAAARPGRGCGAARCRPRRAGSAGERAAPVIDSPAFKYPERQQQQRRPPAPRPLPARARSAAPRACPRARRSRRPGGGRARGRSCLGLFSLHLFSLKRQKTNADRK